MDAQQRMVLLQYLKRMNKEQIESCPVPIKEGFNILGVSDSDCWLIEAFIKKCINDLKESMSPDQVKASMDQKRAPFDNFNQMVAAKQQEMML